MEAIRIQTAIVSVLALAASVGHQFLDAPQFDANDGTGVIAVSHLPLEKGAEPEFLLLDKATFSMEGTGPNGKALRVLETVERIRTVRASRSGNRFTLHGYGIEALEDCGISGGGPGWEGTEIASEDRRLVVADRGRTHVILQLR
jgi:hypothetical protein